MSRQRIRPKHFRRKALTTLFVLIPATIIWIVLGIRRNKELQSAFDRISAGMSRDEVAAIMGTPSRIEKNCDEAIVFRGQPDFAKCTEEDVYPIWFTLGDHWEIYFDTQGRVIYTNAILSP